MYQHKQRFVDVIENLDRYSPKFRRYKSIIGSQIINLNYWLTTSTLVFRDLEKNTAMSQTNPRWIKT